MWKESKLSRVTQLVQITHNGQPLGGATVTCEPESFLGDQIQPATGITNFAGRCGLSIPSAAPHLYAGLPPGSIASR